MKRKVEIFAAAVRIGLGVVFVAASVHKILSPAAFAHEVQNYRILPVALVNPFAIVVPWVELFCGLALIANRWMEGASALVAFMMAVFTVAVASALVRGLNISCGCFKSGGSAATWTTLARDVALCLAAAIVLVRTVRREKWNSPT